MTTRTDAQNPPRAGGDLRERATTQSRSTGAPAGGDPLDDWEAVATARFAEAEHNFRSLASDVTQVIAATRMLHACLQRGNKVMFCGNGGSAADAQHLSTELMGRFLRDRRPLPSVALTVDTSALTAIGNDYGFDQCFARQVHAHGRPGDVLLTLSTSGASVNLLRAVDAAGRGRLVSWAMTGPTPNPLAGAVDDVLAVDCAGTPSVQDVQQVAVHLLCLAFELHGTGP
jgi:D-sedoheptulose 7-phosphate isomerase